MGTNRRGRKFKEVIFFLGENVDNTHAAALLFFIGFNQKTSVLFGTSETQNWNQKIWF